MHRRRFLESAALAGTVTPLLFTTTFARQSATPVATPVTNDGPDFGPTLAERVARIAPETMLEALRTTAVTSTLFPADTPPVEPEVWDDFGDTDLQGTLGGVVFNTGFDENDNFLGIGAAIVHPEADSAARSAIVTAQEQNVEFGGLLLRSPIYYYQNIDYGLAIMQADYLIIGGSAQAEKEGAGVQPTLLFRSIAYTAALLDHLDGVLLTLEE